MTARKQTRAERDLRRDIARHGLVITAYQRGRHHRFLVKMVEGKTALIVFPVTASDWRAPRNFNATLKRLAHSEA